MKLAIGCDPNATSMKQCIINLCEKLGYEMLDMGSDDPIYANTACCVAKAVVSGEVDRGILICGTGIGMSIAANKIRGVYAALISDAYSAERASKSNHANIACFGAFTLGEKLVRELVRIWLNSEYDPTTGSEPKVKGIRELEIKHEAVDDKTNMIGSLI